MSDTALLEKGDPSGSHWVRRTVLVGFCLVLLGTLGVVFTRAVAERVPEQRATLEKLITERTGLAVRFDNVHFTWDLDGTSAVFTRVELTDPAAGRVRVVAPELRVEFDTWDFLRHHQFSLGHVTLSSPDIDIVGDPDESVIKTLQDSRPGNTPKSARDDEAALLRRYLSWAELMPNGRIEVEGARVHLKRRGERAARSSFTLSQAVVSRGGTNFNAYGTMLLAQDVGQSLFVSAKLAGLGSEGKPSGELRLIARRVFLDKLSLPGVRGRATVDVKIHLLEGRVAAANLQASARELELRDDDAARFDHVTLSGKLARDAGDVLLDFTDLQLTRGARLERAPNISARVSFAPGSTRVSRSVVRAERLPFMASELIAGLLAPQLDTPLPQAPDGWLPTAGVLREVRFDSGARQTPDAWTFTALLSEADFARAADHAQLSQLAARVRFDAHQLELLFDPANAAALRIGDTHAPLPLTLAGHLAMTTQGAAASFRFEGLDLRSGTAMLAVDGAWGEAATQTAPLAVRVANIDRALLSDAWTLIAREAPLPAPIADIAQGRVIAGNMQLFGARAGTAARGVDWQRSSGKLTLADLTSAGEDMPRLTAGNGALEFARGGAQLRLAAGQIDDLSLTGAQLDWPRTGAPRLHATLEGALASTLLRDLLAGQGLERLTGNVAIEADARGERELREPQAWRVTARISDATVPLAGGLPAVEKLNGTLRYGNRQLRALTLSGNWLGGPVGLEAKRGNTRGLNIGINGVADAAPLLQLLGQRDVANRVSGQLAWSGSAQRLTGDDAWQISLASNLSGIESRLPAPFEKTRARPLPVNAQLRVDAAGMHEFAIDGDRFDVRGQVERGAITAHFEVQGVAGSLRRAAGADPQLDLERLDLKRAPALLAAAGALLPIDGELAMTVSDLRYAERSLGALHAAIARRPAGVEFSLDSPLAEPYQISAQGVCDFSDRCRAQFTADTSHLAALLHGVQLPAEWPTETLHAAGVLDWPMEASDLTRALAGHFDLETQGVDSNHQLVAKATLADGQIQLDNVQGAGPAPTQVFHGTGRVSLVARNYDLTVDYEQVALAATAVPNPARAGFARAWNALRGSVARRGWTEAPESHRVQWHGTWDAERPD